MEKNKSEIVNHFIYQLKTEIEKSISPILRGYAFDEKIKLRFEEYKNEEYKYYSFGYSVIFLDRINEDDYGFDLSFKVPENNSFMESVISRGNGSLILNPRRLDLDSEQTQREVKDLIDEFVIVSCLLVKAYILEYES